MLAYSASAKGTQDQALPAPFSTLFIISPGTQYIRKQQQPRPRIPEQRAQKKKKMAIQDPGFWERFNMPTHHDEHSAKEPVTLVQIASSSSSRYPPNHQSYHEYQIRAHKRSKRRLVIGGILLVIMTTVLTIVMVWLGVNGWFSDDKEAHKPQYPD
ncbi:MAG: hypothetical protein Q9221_001571 [Calogaya cf. arnoldii]